MKLFFLAIAFFCSALTLSADPLTLHQAVEIGLANNYAIRIARTTTEKSRNTRKLKAGALLPAIRVDGTAASTYTDYAENTATQHLASGRTNEAQVGGSLSWTLFDGFRMFHAADHIDRQIDLNREAMRQTIESSVVAIITAFYDLVAKKSLLAISERQVALSRKQLLYLENQQEYGRVGARDLLNQQVLLNSDSSAILARSIEVTTALHALNVALGRTPDESIECNVDSSVSQATQTPSYWYEKALHHNAGLKMEEIRKNIACSQLAIAKAVHWPVIAINGSLNQSFADPANLRSRGEVTLSLPLFSGFTRITALQNAVLDTLASDHRINQQKLELQAHIYEQWERLSNSCIQIAFEKHAVALAKKSVELSMEQFRMGRISDVQFRESQNALLNAALRFQTALFTNKIIATQLDQLAGTLTL